MDEPAQPLPSRQRTPLGELVADAVSAVDRLDLRALELQRLVVRLAELTPANVVEERLESAELSCLQACVDAVYGLAGAPDELQAKLPLAGEPDQGRARRAG